MNNLEVKKVPFLGTELMAARDTDGQVWAGVRWMCDGIGLSQGQAKAERLKIRDDKVLSKGGRNFVLPTAGGDQNTLCLKLDFVPLWLAKIAITPKMEHDTPELAERLMEYQLKAKDVLAAAFLTRPEADVRLVTPAPPELSLSGLASVSRAARKAVLDMGGSRWDAGVEVLAILNYYGLPVPEFAPERPRGSYLRLMFDEFFF